MAAKRKKASLGRFKLTAKIVERGTLLRWNHLPGCTLYVVQWLNQEKQWRGLDYLEEQEIVRDDQGFVEHIDKSYGSGPVGGTYRITAEFNRAGRTREVNSSPVVVRAPAPPGSKPQELRRRLKEKKVPPRIAQLILSLKPTPHGWCTTLPAEVGKCLGQRVDVQVYGSAITDGTLATLQMIFADLPKLLSRAEKAFEDEGGANNLDEEDKLARPRITIDPEKVTGKSAGPWTLIVEVKNSDFGWHIEFVGKRFKELWAGD